MKVRKTLILKMEFELEPRHLKELLSGELKGVTFSGMEGTGGIFVKEEQVKK